jgi:predicted RNA-binding Zn-ribbon protein involved in translation (DUF1610 family)
VPLDLAPLTLVPDLFTVPKTERAMDCKHCSAALQRLETKPGFQAFHCPSCDFVIIESVRHDAQEGRAVSSSDRSELAAPDCAACG